MHLPNVGLRFCTIILARVLISAKLLGDAKIMFHGDGVTMLPEKWQKTIQKNDEYFA